MREFIKTHRTYLILLIAAGSIVYFNTLWNGMFWDDNDFILNNQYVQDFTVEKFFSENVIAGAGFHSNYWRPMLLIVFSGAYQIWGGWTAGYHMINMAVHIANGLLLFYLVFLLFKSRPLAFLTSLIFLIHPVTVEAVSYANSLGDPLSVFLMLGAIILYSKGQRALPLICFALALMIKETAIILPALILLIEFLPHQDEINAESNTSTAQNSLSHRVRELIKKILPYILIACGYIALRATVLNFGGTFNLYEGDTAFSSHLATRIFTFFRIFTTYLAILVWPHNLHMERSVDIATSFVSPSVIIGAVLITLLVILAFFMRKKIPTVWFGSVWFLVGLAPTSNIAVPINGLLYEHWLYLPLAGFSMAAIAAAYACIQRKPLLTKPLYAILCIILIGYAIQSIRRNGEWHDAITLYTQTLRFAPGSYRVNNNLGMAYAETGRDTDAIAAYNRAIAIDPTISVAYYNRGNLYRDRARQEEAIASYQAAIQHDPKFIFAARSLASIYLKEKNYRAALPYLETLREYDLGDENITHLIQNLREKIEKSSQQANP